MIVKPNVLNINSLKKLNCSLGPSGILTILFLYLCIFLAACDPGGELPLLDQPNVTVVANDQSVQLNWTEIEGAEYYLIYQSDSETINQNKAIIFQSTDANLVIDNLDNNKTYYFAVTSIGKTGESLLKSSISSTPKPTPPKPPPPPTPIAPRNITITPGSEAVTISWDKSPEAEKYNLYIARSPGITKDNIDSLSGWMIQRNISSPFTQTGLINGSSHYLVLTAENESGESQFSEELETVPTISLKLSMGQNHTCSILSDHSLWCWGYNNMGQLGDKTFESKSTPVNISPEIKWIDVFAGPLHTCAITTENKLWCWGSNTYQRLGGDFPNQVNFPVEINDFNAKWLDISVGLDITCGITDDEKNKLLCWGKQDYLPTITPTSILVTDKDKWKAVFVNGLHNCALREDLTLWCWGNNLVGQLGNNQYSSDITPYRNSLSKVLSTTGWNTVALSSSLDSPENSFSCGIKNDESLWCWGGNHFGQLGAPYIIDSVPNPVPATADSYWKSIGVGLKHACAVKSDSTLWCMGKSPHGQSGAIDYFASVNTLTQFNLDNDWSNVVANDETSCASKKDGTIWCTGRSNHGQLGVDNYGFAKEPVAVVTEVDHYSVSAHHVCLNKDFGDVFCWGKNNNGQIGDGSLFDRSQPSDIMYNTEGTVTTSKNNNCTIAQDRDIVCWGFFKYRNGKKELKPRDFYYVRDWNNSSDTADWRNVSIGDINHCAIKTNNTLWCLENFLTIENYIAINKIDVLEGKSLTQVGSSSSWKDVILNANQACAIDQNKTLWCWGINEYGELGTNNTQNYHLPEKIEIDHSWNSFSLGKTHTCGIDDVDELWCWGNNEFGQLGDNSFENKHYPRKIKSNIGWKNIQLSDTRSCGVKLDNTLWCWGLSLPTSNSLETELLDNLNIPQQIVPQIEWEDVGIGHRFICATSTSRVLYCWGDNTNGELGNGKAWSKDWNKVNFPASKVILK